jgi:predicted membrane channel-forming protein YqfA (hemolysin III family)
LALLGFYRYLRGEGVGGDFLGAVVIGEGLIIGVAVVGALLYTQGFRPVRADIHILYGIVAVLSFPAFYAFLQGRDGRREMLLWGLMALFVFGLLLRAQEVG